MSKFLGDVTFVSDGNDNKKFTNIAIRANPVPKDGDMWRIDNTNTGLKTRINGVTKTVTVS